VLEDAAYCAIIAPQPARYSMIALAKETGELACNYDRFVEKGLDNLGVGKD